MKKTKLGVCSLFCAGMLSLSACKGPATVYGPPSDSDTDVLSSVTEEPQDVYGPPPVDAEQEDSEAGTAAAEKKTTGTETTVTQTGKTAAADESTTVLPKKRETGTRPSEDIFRPVQVVYGPPNLMDEPKTID